MYTLHLFFAEAQGLLRQVALLSMLQDGETLREKGADAGWFMHAFVMAQFGRGVQRNSLLFRYFPMNVFFVSLENVNCT